MWQPLLHLKMMIDYPFQLPFTKLVPFGFKKENFGMVFGLFTL
jgi:hypothetical protein